MSSPEILVEVFLVRTPRGPRWQIEAHRHEEAEPFLRAVVCKMQWDNPNQGRCVDEMDREDIPAADVADAALILLQDADKDMAMPFRRPWHQARWSWGTLMFLDWDSFRMGITGHRPRIETRITTAPPTADHRRESILPEAQTLADLIYSALMHTPADKAETALIFPAWVLATMVPAFMRLKWAELFRQRLSDLKVVESHTDELQARIFQRAAQITEPTLHDVFEQLMGDVKLSEEHPHMLEKWRSELPYPSPEAPNPINYPLLSQKGVMLIPSIWVAYCAVMASLPLKSWLLLSDRILSRVVK